MIDVGVQLALPRSGRRVRVVRLIGEGSQGAVFEATDDAGGLAVKWYHDATGTPAQRRRIEERVEAEWRKPLAALLEGFTPLDLDIETLEGEAARVVEQLEGIGPVNPLAVEEHAEESTRLEFLTTQRDDLVSARQSLLQAIREIDGTARNLFMETFTAVQGHFQNVFQTLFGGGECGSACRWRSRHSSTASGSTEGSGHGSAIADVADGPGVVVRVCQAKIVASRCEFGAGVQVAGVVVYDGS